MLRRLLGALVAVLAVGVPASAAPLDEPSQEVSGGFTPTEAPPWVARLVSDNRSLCTGALVADQWVLTAAHCVDGSVMTITLGRLVVDSGEGITRTAAPTNMIVHPDWPGCTDSVCNFDAALVRLDSPVPDHWEVLPLLPDSAGMARGEDVSYMGYGLTGPDTIATELQQTPDGAFSFDGRCLTLTFLDALVCLRQEGSSVVRGGDSGGPWLARKEGAWVHVAVHDGGDDPELGTFTPDIRAWVRVQAGLETFVAGDVLKDKVNGTAWLMASDGFRVRIPNRTVLECLKDAGANVRHRLAVEVSAIPERVGVDATCDPAATPTVVPTASATPTAVPTPTATATVAPTLTPTATPSPTATPIPAPTVTPTSTVTPIPTPTVTPTPTLSPTATPTRTPTPTPSPPRCQGRIATIVGTSGDDELIGTDGPDVIVAGAGRDVIRAGRGADVICAGRGADRIYAGRGADSVIAGPGADRVFGGSGRDRIWGRTGNDRVAAGPGDDKVAAGTGADLINGGDGQDLCNGGRDTDRHTGGCETLLSIP